MHFKNKEELDKAENERNLHFPHGFCPNCAAPLDAESVNECWSCNANISSQAAWGATVLPTCTYSPPNASLGKLTDERRSKIERGKTLEIIPFPKTRLARILGTLFTTFLIWLGIGFFAIVSVLPYGGTSGLLGFWMFSTFILPVLH